MKHSRINISVAEVHAATVADQVACADAMELGMSATQPLSATRLAELCALGDRMIRTGRRKRLALACLGKLLEDESLAA
ncbi:MAG: hypothetical protein V4864_06720 [Pseudomonadota bacterium]